MTTIPLFLKCVTTLYRVGHTMRHQGLAALQDSLRHAVTRSSRARSEVELICSSIDLVCAFYPEPVLCLQRSVATALLLRQVGWDAKLIIGVTITPFYSHAWVEIEQAVVNDKPYMREIYQVVQVC